VKPKRPDKMNFGISLKSGSPVFFILAAIIRTIEATKYLRNPRLKAVK
jgi:hypothetical protein